jgi:hypothetical protein
MPINETVLEMHFHAPLLDLFRQTYGVGEQGQVNFYKYSPQKEAFVGFDQAYALTELSLEDFFSLLKQSAASNGYKLERKVVAYFLQFKVVKPMKNMQKTTPKVVTASPHYRATLDTAKNQKTGHSQHELLYALSKNAGAMVYYACPMIFDREELYLTPVDLDKLQLADLVSCPSDYQDNATHHLYFQTPTSQPFWCSIPTQGQSDSPEQFVNKVVEQVSRTSEAETWVQLRKLLLALQQIVMERSTQELDDKIEAATAVVHDSLTILEFQRQVPVQE